MALRIFDLKLIFEFAFIALSSKFNSEQPNLFAERERARKNLSF
jgi:hypothetical protein